MPRSRLATRDLALIALFAALIAALSLPGAFSPFGIGVPITAQSLGVMLAGSILGARRGALAVLSYLALAAAGLPILAGGQGGLGAMVGPSGGYLVGFVGAAWLIGWLTEKRLPSYHLLLGLLANLLGGIVVMYAVGIPWQAWRMDTSGLLATAVAALVYLPGDLIKAVIATAVAKGVHRGYPTVTRDHSEENRRLETNTDCN